MECLFFLSFSSSILLACYDGTCYLDETLHCNMYGWNNVYVQLAMYEWMELYMYARWNLCAGYVICLLLNSPVKYIYIYICHIFAVKIAGLKKTEKRGTFAISRAFAVRRWWQRHICLQWQTAKTCPAVTSSWRHSADGKGRMLFAVSGGRQRLPLAA